MGTAFGQKRSFKIIVIPCPKAVQTARKNVATSRGFYDLLALDMDPLFI